LLLSKLNVHATIPGVSAEYTLLLLLLVVAVAVAVAAAAAAVVVCLVILALHRTPSHYVL